MTPFQKILNLGISSETSPLNRQYIRITNSINLLFIFAVSIPLIIAITSLTNDGIDSYSRFILLIAFSVLCLSLNKFHLNKSAKIVTSIAPIFALIIYPIFISNFIHAGMFLWIPYAIMALGVVPFFIFSLHQEKVLMFSVIGLYILLIVGFDEMLLYYFDELPDLDFIKKYYLYYLFAKIAITVFLYTTFLIFKLMYHNNRVELFKLSEELKQKNKTLHILNTTLENKVAERTVKLSLQNERIKNLAHTNAHEIRAYIVRILGLLNLKQHNVSENEKEFCDSKIHENISDLDKITQKLSSELIEEN